MRTREAVREARRRWGIYGWAERRLGVGLVPIGVVGSKTPDCDGVLADRTYGIGRSFEEAFEESHRQIIPGEVR